MNRKLYIFFTFFALIFISFNSTAQIEQDICRIENGKLIFELKTNYSQTELKQLRDLFGIDSVLYHTAVYAKTTFTYNGETWFTKKRKDKRVVLWKEIDNKGITLNLNIPFLSSFYSQPNPPQISHVNWGYNKLKNEKAVTITSDSTTFQLLGFQNASQVVLSGSFNNWNTQQLRMHKNALGWFISLPLKPGYYEYKYIIDGEWRIDESNQLTTDDLQGGENSVLFIPNHQFELRSEKDFHKVYLAGSFNNWNPSDVKLLKKGNLWYLPVWLNDGTHSYKFIADNMWMSDPGNPNRVPDGHDDFNSVIAIGDSVQFQLDGYPQAKSVILSGSFNNWNTSEIKMVKNGNSWVCDYVLGSGNHEYKYIVDGEWIIDPKNPMTRTSNGITNSLLILHPNYTFNLNRYKLAKKVIVTGTFNNWEQESFEMLKKGDRWTISLYLPKGKVLYKFIVDGEWILDPDNKDWEENAEGTGNSILWIPN